MGSESYGLGCSSTITQDIVAVNRFGTIREAEVSSLAPTRLSLWRRPRTGLWNLTDPRQEVSASSECLYIFPLRSSLIQILLKSQNCCRALLKSIVCSRLPRTPNRSMVGMSPLEYSIIQVFSFMR